jgi:hypothetical protein
MSLDPQFGFRARMRLMEERKKAGGTLPWPEVDRFLQECFDETTKAFTAVHPAPKKKRLASSKDMDEEWIKSLESNPLYDGIDVRKELGKATMWASVRGVGVTQRRFINWLARAMQDRPMRVTGIGQSSFQRASVLVSEPNGWREWARINMSDPENAEKPWSSFDPAAQKYIISQLSP